jgi:hypothetical protein
MYMYVLCMYVCTSVMYELRTYVCMYVCTMYVSMYYVLRTSVSMYVGM